MGELQAIDALSALAHETRLRIVRFLIKAGPSGAAAGEIAAAVDATSSRSSFHLASLEHAGIVRSERVSRNIIYRADFERIGGVVNYLLEDCCGNHPDILACCNQGASCQGD